MINERGRQHTGFFFFVGNKEGGWEEGIKIGRFEVMQPKRNVISPPARLARWCWRAERGQELAVVAEEVSL